MGHFSRITPMYVCGHIFIARWPSGYSLYAFDEISFLYRIIPFGYSRSCIFYCSPLGNNPGFFFSLRNTTIKILPRVSHRIPWQNKNAVYRLQVSALIPEIFVFEKYVKYAKEMIDDVIYSTHYYMKYNSRAILANFHHRPLKLGRLIVLKETHQRL